MGSSAWGNTVRMAFSFTRHHDDHDLYICTASKTNHKKPEGLSYRIKQEEIMIGAIKVITSRIDWQTGKVNMDADEAVNKKAYDQRCETEIAKEFILRMLMSGAKSRDDIYKAAENEEINQHTLKLARQKLKQEGTNIIMEGSQMDKRKFIWYIGK
jgi:hypothetical protein